jgi:hypothetical protein
MATIAQYELDTSKPFTPHALRKIGEYFEEDDGLGVPDISPMTEEEYKVGCAYRDLRLRLFADMTVEQFLRQKAAAQEWFRRDKNIAACFPMDSEVEEREVEAAYV